MNLTAFDVTEAPEVRVGDELVLLGGQGDEYISADEWAGLTGTISYEVFCIVGGQNKPEYIA